MSEIIGNIEDIEQRLAALAILEDCVQRMMLWEAPYVLDERSVKKIDTLLRRAEEDEYIDNQIYIMAQCIRIVTDLVDRIEHGEED